MTPAPADAALIVALARSMGRAETLAHRRDVETKPVLLAERRAAA